EVCKRCGVPACGEGFPAILLSTVPPMIVIPGKIFLPGPEEVPELPASPDPATDLSISDAARFGSGEMAKLPRASPGGREIAGSATAGIGLSARKFIRSGLVT